MEKKYFGVMLDCSRNAVMKVEQVKKFVDYISSFGYNMLQLYTEDTYEVRNEPYFGYMRGRYTKEELKEIDAYCASKGVELIPCIQTLAHLGAIFRWKEYRNVCDAGDILLVNEKRTYALIENMFATIAECFQSRKVNVGMDEAHLLGLGQYLNKYGYKDRFTILSEHLEKITKIADKYNFKLMMWSDMFFRLASGGNYYNTEAQITEEIREKVPKNLSLIFWDYYHEDKFIYDGMLDAHKQFHRDIWFAGGVWTWMGFAPHNAYSMRTMETAMRSCREKNVDNIFLTMWGDNGKECSFFSVLPTLFYLKKIYDGESNKTVIEEEFQKLTGENFQAMMDLDLPNQIYDGAFTAENPCKYGLYADPFAGALEKMLYPYHADTYRAYANTLKQHKKNSQFSYIFDCLYKLCRVLELKHDLSIRIRSAYTRKDKATLAGIAKEMKTLIVRVQSFYRAFRVLWYQENKPNGFEVQDARLGGLIQRLKNCREQLLQYVDGRLESLPELEEEPLPVEWEEPWWWNNWATNISVNIV